VLFCGPVQELFTSPHLSEINENHWRSGRTRVMNKMLTRIRRSFLRKPLPLAAEAERQRDHRQLLGFDPGLKASIGACTDWLCAAQDHSASADGGVARDYSLVKGWATSYPETTGYIIPTMIELAKRFDRTDLHQRARRMLDWCVSIQFPEGGFQGGKVDATPRIPVTFNTGQILLGLAAGAKVYAEDAYLRSMSAAANWLRDTQDDDGCWRKHPTPFAAPGEKAYETHVAWGLFEADRVAPGHGWGDAGLRQVEWALTKQQANGWFSSNCLSDPKNPLTHTLGYVLRGLLEGHLFSGRADLLAAARRTADGILPAIDPKGSLAGRLDQHWQAGAPYVCLTGSAQLGHCMLLLYAITGNASYLSAGKRLNANVRRTVALDGAPGVRGGVKGSFPVDGDYGSFEYLNWAAKFCIDTNLLEGDIEQIGADDLAMHVLPKLAKKASPAPALG